MINKKQLSDTIITWWNLWWKNFCKTYNILQWHKKEWLEMINTYNNTQSLIRDENILSYKENKLIKDLHNLWTSEDLIHNFHFHTQHLKNWTITKDLIADPFRKIYYHREEDKKNLIRMMKHYLNYNIIITEQDKKNLYEIIEDIYDGKNVFVYTNHISLANIPILLKMLEDMANDLWKDKFNNRCYTTLWWLIMTLKTSRDTILWQSHVIKTHPKTDTGYIDLLKNEQNEQRKAYFQEVKKLCEDTKQDGIGKLFVIALSGTRNIQINQDWKQRIISWDDDTESEKSSIQMLNLIINRIDPDAKVSMIGMNESNIRTIDNKRVRKENVYVATKNLDQENLNTIIQEKQFMPILWSLTLDKNWKPIWQAVSSKEFNELRKQSKQTSQTK